MLIAMLFREVVAVDFFLMFSTCTMDKQVVEAIVKNDVEELERLQRCLLLKLEEKKFLSEGELQKLVKEGKLHRDVTSEAFLPSRYSFSKSGSFYFRAIS